MESILSILAGIKTSSDLRAFTESELALAKKLVQAAVTTQEPSLDVLHKIDEAIGILAFCSAVATIAGNLYQDAEIRQTAGELASTITHDSVEIFQTPRLYDLVLAMKPTILGTVDQFWVEKYLQEAKRSGANLALHERQSLLDRYARLKELSARFNQNMSKSSDPKNSLKIPAFEVYQLELPQEMVLRLSDKEGNLIASHKDASQFMSSCKSRPHRKLFWHAEQQLAWPDNEPVLREILEIRLSIAKMFGFYNWADFQSAELMTESGSGISSFIEKLNDALSERAREKIADWSRRFLGEEEAYGWDAIYLYQCSSSAYGADDTVFRQYASTSQVLEGAFALDAKLFGLKITQIKSPPDLWSDDVIVYEFCDSETNEILGQLILDLYPRDGKYQGRAHLSVTTGVTMIPTGVLIGNFPAPGDDDPGLSLRETVGLFHEVGHALMSMMTKIQWNLHADYPIDYVEIASNFHQELATTAEGMRHYAHDRKTGEQMPEDLIKLFCGLKTVVEAVELQRQLSNAEYCLRIHQVTDLEQVNIPDLMRLAQLRYSPFQATDELTLAQAVGWFSHPANMYAAAYYSYFQGLIIGRDMAEQIFSEGSDPSVVGKKFRQEFFAKGFSRHGAESIRQALGREPNLQILKKG